MFLKGQRKCACRIHISSIFFQGGYVQFGTVHFNLWTSSLSSDTFNSDKNIDQIIL